jgi:dihydroorotate dehydrogenase
MYKELIDPMLSKLDSEVWHTRARNALHFAETTPATLKLLEKFAYKGRRFVDERLHVTLGGVEFENPLLVGAGWDKSGKAVKGLYTLGFAGIEVGSVTAHPQPGNPKPRQFMLAPGVALNRLGFNSPGMDAVARNLERYQKSAIPLGISLGKNKDVPASEVPEAHAAVTRRLYQHAAYFAVNVSSPNTPGLRSLQDKAPLTDIVQAVNAVMDELGERKPLFVKIAPELTERAIDDVIEVVVENGLTGIIATNTTIDPDLKAMYGERWLNEEGGLSGDNAIYRRTATQKIAHIYRETAGRVEIIGVGGIKDVATALEKIKAGARAVQVVTAIRGEGTTLAGRITRGIAAYLDRTGAKSVEELIGIDAK